MALRKITKFDFSELSNSEDSLREHNGTRNGVRTHRDHSQHSYVCKGRFSPSSSPKSSRVPATASIYDLQNSQERLFSDYNISRPAPKSVQEKGSLIKHVRNCWSEDIKNNKLPNLNPRLRHSKASRSFSSRNLRTNTSKASPKSKSESPSSSRSTQRFFDWSEFRNSNRSVNPLSPVASPIRKHRRGKSLGSPRQNKLSSSSSSLNLTNKMTKHQRVLSLSDIKASPRISPRVIQITTKSNIKPKMMKKSKSFGASRTRFKPAKAQKIVYPRSIPRRQQSYNEKVLVPVSEKFTKTQLDRSFSDLHTHDITFCEKDAKPYVSQSKKKNREWAESEKCHVEDDIEKFQIDLLEFDAKRRVAEYLAYGNNGPDYKTDELINFL